MAERLVTPPPVPTTSIYSKTDGIADWQGCLNPQAPQVENVEVDGGHLAGIWNLAAVKVILDRLAQPEDNWKPLQKDSVHAPKPPAWHKTQAAKRKLFTKDRLLHARIVRPAAAQIKIQRAAAIIYPSTCPYSSARRRPAARPS